MYHKKKTGKHILIKIHDDLFENWYEESNPKTNLYYIHKVNHQKHLYPIVAYPVHVSEYNDELNVKDFFTKYLSDSYDKNIKIAPYLFEFDEIEYLPRNTNTMP